MGPSHRLPIMPLAIPDSKKCEAKKQMKRKEEKEQIYPNNVGQTDRSIPSLPISDREKRAPKGAAQGQPRFSHVTAHKRCLSQLLCIHITHYCQFCQASAVDKDRNQKKIWNNNNCLECVHLPNAVCVCVCV